MVLKRTPWHHFALASSLSSLLMTSWSHAMPESTYRSALQLAEKQAIKNQNRVRFKTQGLSPSLSKELYGNPYRVGDSWEIASWQFQPTNMLTSVGSDKTLKKVSNGRIFHYEVIRSESNSSQQPALKITQVEFKNFKLADTRMELYPLDYPDVSTANRSTPTALPQLPPQVQEAADQLGFKVNLSQCQWFEQDDFFGRPIQILWQKGDPWPAYVKTSGGISILIHRESL